jgi:hypothetical protein
MVIMAYVFYLCQVVFGAPPHGIDCVARCKKTHGNIGTGHDNNLPPYFGSTVKGGATYALYGAGPDAIGDVGAVVCRFESVKASILVPGGLDHCVMNYCDAALNELYREHTGLLPMNSGVHVAACLLQAPPPADDDDTDASDDSDM